MTKELTKIVIVGHVDHGKSTLIGRLLLDTGSLPKEKIQEMKRISNDLGKETELAFITDQLKEEREKNITIDTTQIFFQTRKKNYCIIDAPGHVEFIQNMMTGASQAEHAVLIVDAQEGVREQTRRHAYLLNLLGLKSLIVVANKMDLVGYKEAVFKEVKDELEGFLQKLDIEPSEFIPISAREGDNISKRSKNMPWYRGANFLSALDAFSPPLEGKKKPLRMPIQDIYDQDKKKIIVGEISAGELHAGEEVTIAPAMRDDKILSIEVFMQKKSHAESHENIGVTLQNPDMLKRGNVICSRKNPPSPRESFRANIFWMAPEPLLKGKTMTLKCATQEVECVVDDIIRKIDSETLEVLTNDNDVLCQHESGSVLLRTKEQIVVERFDDIEELGRFVIENNADLQGAGIVL